MKKAWIKSMQEEGLQHFRKSTFKIKKLGEGEEMVGVTAKFRAKKKQDGNLEKCKSRWCLRGDQQEERTDNETWCAIENASGTRVFLADAVSVKQRVYMLDFKGAFIQLHKRDRTFTRLPKEWAAWFSGYEHYFGVDLLVLLALYGDVTANKC